jgi:L-ascorbate metabolism protein UlaG (beta-lactamase superfamily)
MLITWFGHSTIGIEAGGTRLLTDPVLTRRLAHLRRRRGPVPGPEAADCDAVLVSHLHVDHLHTPSLRRIMPRQALILPRGGAGLVARECGRALGDRCVEVAPGDRVEVGALTVTAVPARHDGRRGPWTAVRGRPLGFRIDGALSAWYAGDTDLYDDMPGAVGPVDLALVPVGGWGPTLGPGHLDPTRAVEAVRRVRARTAVPVHYGTFWPVGLDWLRPDRFLLPGEQFRTRMAAADPEVRVTVLAPGEVTEVVSR